MTEPTDSAALAQHTELISSRSTRSYISRRRRRRSTKPPDCMVGGWDTSPRVPHPWVRSPPGLVTAVFYNFRPEMVARAIPDAWQYSSPARALTARTAVADAALRRLWGDAVDGAEVRDAAEAAMAVARALRGGGRPIYTATATLDEPNAPHLKLWHACTLLREHRFDGHVAALTVHGLDGLEVARDRDRRGLRARRRDDPPLSWVDRGGVGRGRGSSRGPRHPRWRRRSHRGGTRTAEQCRGDDGPPCRRHLGSQGCTASREEFFAGLQPLARLLENDDGIRCPNRSGSPAQVRSALGLDQAIRGGLRFSLTKPLSAPLPRVRVPRLPRAHG